MEVVMMKQGRVVKSCVLILMLMISILCLSSCSGKTDVKLTHANGAEVQFSAENVDLSAKENVLFIKHEGDSAIGQLVDVPFVNESVGQFSRDSSYNTFTANNGTGIGYGIEGTYEHLIPLDDNTYLRLQSSSEDALFNLESLLKIDVLKHGAAAVDDFSSHFSE
jgi:hypothetical protein